jgi:putative hydrolase of the HAD superfamily
VAKAGVNWRFSAVVFDLWGTLVPLPASVRLRGIEVMAPILGVPFAELRPAWEAAWRERATGALEAVVHRVCERANISVNEMQVQSALTARRTVHSASFCPRDDAVPTLRALKDAGIRVGLITNCSSDTPDLWAASPLAPLTHAAVFSSAEGMMKPSAAFYLRLCERLQVAASACLYVGDGSDDELAGAADVGMTPMLLDAEDTLAPVWDGRRIGALHDVVEAMRMGGGRTTGA